MLMSQAVRHARLLEFCHAFIGIMMNERGAAAP
jgi:hypothetical protein